LRDYSNSTQKVEFSDITGLPKIEEKPVAFASARIVFKKRPASVSGFSWGWCTYWVAKRRAEMGQPVTWRGNARDWYENAKAQGYLVGSRPEVGAIYVTRAENSGGTRSGHVALVIEVNDAGVVLEEMNFTGFGKVSTRFLTYAELSTRRAGFIYSRAIIPSPDLVKFEAVTSTAAGVGDLLTNI